MMLEAFKRPADLIMSILHNFINMEIWSSPIYGKIINGYVKNVYEWMDLNEDKQYL